MSYSGYLSYLSILGKIHSGKIHDMKTTFGGIGTVTKRMAICHFAMLLSSLHTEGSIVEIGVARGDCSKLISENISENYNLHLFDTFCGLPNHTIEDELNDKIEGGLNFSLEYVKQFIGEKENIFYHKGMIEDTYKSLPDDIVLCHIDCDLFSGVYTSLKYVIPKLKNGGCIIIDDYNNSYFKGVTKACNQIEKEFNIKINILHDTSQQGIYCKSV